ncbi:SPFH domain-containing protein [Streptomyces sp. NPDC005794]|uniref:SPFH domain-containing protein n=1 Tax=Streptomyces sp. NPDC005794 TaxID=3364733 RepID=UPI0036A438E9
MRSTENVRGEWDELGERDARVVLPGPGAGDAQREAPAGVPPVAEPEEARAPVGAAVEVPAVGDDDIPADLGPALDAVAVVGPTAPAVGRVPAHMGLDMDLDVGSDPAPAPALPDLEPAPRLEVPALEQEQVDPEPDPAPGPKPLDVDPVSAPGPAPEEVADAVPEAEPVPAGLGSGPEDGPPDLRKPVSGGVPLSTGEGRAPAALTGGAAKPGAWWGAGPRRPVIATETTAPIPVHLLFRDDGHDGEPAGTGGTAAGSGVERRPADRRPPPPRSPRVQGPTRPAPLADPRLTERPGPVLPGWSALLTSAAGAVAVLAVLGWHGALPAAVTGRLGLGARPYHGIGTGTWALLALLAAVALFALCGLGRGRAGHASVLTLFGDYRGSARRTGLLWISPLLRRRRIDVRLRHWRSEPLPAVDASGTALRAVVLVVWRVKDTARATLGVADHERYLGDQVEAALARVLSQLPADAFHEDTRTLRDAEAVGDALTRMVKADCVPVGIEVYSAQPTRIEYAPEVAAVMQRCRVAAIDARHRDGVLTSVVDAVDDTVGRLTARGIVELDAYEHKALVRDLTVAFYTGRSGGEGV